MKKATITAILIVSVIGLGLGSLLVTEKVSAQETSCITLKNNLRVGSKDATSNMEVTKLQSFLNSKGYLSISPTGYFGSATSRAVRNFQTKENIPSLGIVGPTTRAKISAITCVQALPAQPTVVPPTAPTAEKPAQPVVAKLPYASTNFIDWAGVWGNVSTTTEGNLLVNARTDTSGAQALLNKSSDWTNYKFSVNIFARQATITLMARYVDENNFLACTYSGRYMEIIQKVNGVSNVVTSTTVVEAPYTRYFYNDLNLAMTVNNKTVSCSLLGDDNLVFNNIDDKLQKGGVGVQVWSNSNGVANIEVKNVRVMPI